MRAVSGRAAGDTRQYLWARALGPDRPEEATGRGVAGTARQADVENERTRRRDHRILLQLDTVAESIGHSGDACAGGGGAGTGRRGELCREAGRRDVGRTAEADHDWPRIGRVPRSERRGDLAK